MNAGLLGQMQVSVGGRMANKVNGSSTSDALRAKIAKLQARVADIERREGAKRRKEDTRLKVIVGAGIIADTEKNPETRAGVRSVLDRAITTPRDREFLKAKGWL